MKALINGWHIEKVDAFIQLVSDAVLGGFGLSQVVLGIKKSHLCLNLFKYRK